MENEFKELETYARLMGIETNEQQEPEVEMDEELIELSVPEKARRLEEISKDLNVEQKAAFDIFVEAKHDKIFIHGSPGVGKTFLAKALVQAHKLLFGGLAEAITPTHKAKKVLSRSIGFEAMTIHRFCGYIMEENKQPIVGSGGKLEKVTETMSASLLIIDEVSMIEKDLFEDATAYIPTIIVLGDVNQLNVINGENADLSQYLHIELTEQMRQTDANSALIKTIEAWKMAIQSSKQYIGPGIRDNTLVQIETYPDDIIKKYVDEEIDVVFAYTNKAVDNYNNMIQKALQGTSEPVEGDRMILQRPMFGYDKVKRKGTIVANNGDDVYLEEIERKHGFTSVTLKGERSNRLLLDSFYMKPGELYKFYQENYERKMYWSEFKANILFAKLPHSMTVHKSQGSTFNNVCVDITNIMSCRDQDTMKRLVYVALSRAKTTAYFV